MKLRIITFTALFIGTLLLVGGIVAYYQLYPVVSNSELLTVDACQTMGGYTSCDMGDIGVIDGVPVIGPVCKPGDKAIAEVQGFVCEAVCCKKGGTTTGK